MQVNEMNRQFYRLVSQDLVQLLRTPSTESATEISNTAQVIQKTRDIVFENAPRALTTLYSSYVEYEASLALLDGDCHCHSLSLPIAWKSHLLPWQLECRRAHFFVCLTMMNMGGECHTVCTLLSSLAGKCSGDCWTIDWWHGCSDGAVPAPPTSVPSLQPQDQPSL